VCQELTQREINDKGGDLRKEKKISKLIEGKKISNAIHESLENQIYEI